MQERKIVLEITTDSPQKTEQLGYYLGRLLFPSSIILLDGDLGAGKTTISKGIARGLGVRSTVTSPSFLLMKEYQGEKLNLYHIDAYRIESAAELFEIGIEEYLDSSGVVVIEWPKVFAEFLPDQYLKITISRKKNDLNDEIRILRLETRGEKYFNLLKELKFSE